MTIHTRHCLDDHQEYLFDELLPNLMNYAGRSSTPPEVVVMAAFLTLASILQSKGLGRETLMQAVDTAALQAAESKSGAHRWH